MVKDIVLIEKNEFIKLCSAALGNLKTPDLTRLPSELPKITSGEIQQPILANKYG